ncbi:MAG TPA: radical SAM protein, partial [Elusimicrobiales bacterium]|nr:radical SAM protein [Elusimicrobiales bacterium]
MTHGPGRRNAPPANRACAENIRKFSAPADLREKAPDGRQRCLACAHKCVIAPGAYGICGSRFNETGVLRAPWGYVSSAGLDPVEKKPFFHALPGSGAFSFGTTGCNFKCGFCQNSGLSRSGREPDSGAADMFPADAGTLAAAARDSGAAFMVSTYNEPLISAEWSVAVMKEAGKYGIRGGFVSNAYASAEALEYIKPHVRIYKADLKTFSAGNYSDVIGGSLEGVLKGIEAVCAGGFWLEIVTLFIPGFNDSRKEMEEIAGYIAGLS